MKKEELIRSLKDYKFPKKIIQALKKVDRSKFIPKSERELAYEDTALPIGYGQTISQPYTIAFMLTQLNIEKRNSKILEIGSGSGYVLALLSKLCPKGKIFGVERIKNLAESSREKLKDYKNIKVIYGDGSKGLKSESPFDRILISASSKELPQKLINQLKINGILVTPVKNSIVVVKKSVKKNHTKEFHGFQFVPLIER